MPRPPRFTSKRTLAPQRAPGIYASTYDPILGAAICRRIAAGESIASICAADPSMPTGKTVWNWARAHPEFAAMKAHALSVARARSLAAQAKRDAARRRGMKRRKRVAWNAGRDGCSDELAVEICERLVMGEALTAICRDPLMPSVGTVYNWLRRYPRFLDSYRKMKAGLADTLIEVRCDALVPPQRERDWGPLFRRTIRAAERDAARVSLKRLAPARGPTAMIVRVEEPDGSTRVIYGDACDGR